MFNRLKELIKGGLRKMNVIKHMEDRNDLEGAKANEEMFAYIEQWKSLYRGFYKPWHNVQYQTLDGKDKERDMRYLNVAKVASNEMSGLIFNEKCNISTSDDKTTEFIDDVLSHNKFNKRFQDHLEYMFAHGGVVAKPYIENDNTVKISFATADCFIPITWKDDTVTEAVFPNEFYHEGNKYTLLEYHYRRDGQNVVRNELYKSNDGSNIGDLVPLGNVFPDLEVEMTFDMERTLFTYFKPNVANNLDLKSPLGIPLFANALDTMKTIHVAFDSFHEEFATGKKRILVPSSMVSHVFDRDTGAMVSYLSNDTVYEQYNDPDGKHKPEEFSVELRVEEHIAGINALLNIYAMQTGFSQGSFTFDGVSMKTATEVISEQSQTFKSKKSHETIIESGLEDLILTILEISRLYKISGVPSNEDIDVLVTFDDSIAEDKGAEIDQQIKLVLNGLTSKKRAIMKYAGVTEEEALEILAEINEETIVEEISINDFNGNEE